MRLSTLFLVLSSASAFQMVPPAFSTSKVTSTALPVVMTNEETESILKSAEDCANSECSIDEVSGLIYDLKEQEVVLQSRLDKIMNMISDLQKLNELEGDDRQVDEIRAFVQDMLRVFNTKKPNVGPVGFAGEIGKGPTTAYDCLPPKPWKA